MSRTEAMMEKIWSTRISHGELGIFWVWQNTYIFKSPGNVLVAIDPYLVKNPVAKHIREPPMAPEEMQVDYVLCTHDHWDHTDPRTLSIIMRCSPKTVFLGTKECCARFLSIGIPAEKVRSLEAGVTVDLHGLKVTPLYSIPPNVAASLGQTTHYSYILDFGFVRVYNFGDSTAETVSDPMSVLSEAIKHRPEIAIFPIVGDFPGRRPEHAVSFTMLLKPKIVIPGHYGCFKDRTIDPKAFLDLISKIPDIKAVVLDSCGSYIYKA
jgi:L-ascorbate metabolism protein UlaG (beta-lactamase superfamily)